MAPEAQEEPLMAILAKLDEMNTKMEESNRRKHAMLAEILDTTQRVAATMSALSGKRAATPTTFASTSAILSRETRSVNPILIPKQPQAAPTKCSTPGPSHEARDPVVVPASTYLRSKTVTAIAAMPLPALGPALSILVTPMGPIANQIGKNSRYIATSTPNTSPASARLTKDITKHETHLMLEMPPKQKLNTSWTFPFMHQTNLLPPYYVASYVFNLDMMLSPAWPPPIQLEIEKVVVQLGPKPPWLSCTGVSSSWSEKIQLVNGFLLETTPWLVCREVASSTCSTYVLGILLKKPWPLLAKVCLIGDGFLLVAMITNNSIELLMQWSSEGLLPTWGYSIFSALFLHHLWPSLCAVQCMILWPAPALVQFLSNNLVKPSTPWLVPRFSDDVSVQWKIPWPSFSFICHQVELQSAQYGLIAFGVLVKQQYTHTMVFSYCIFKIDMPAVIFNYYWLPPEPSQCLSVLLLSPWPPPMVFKILCGSLTATNLVEGFSDPVSVRADCNIFKKSWPPPEQGADKDTLYSCAFYPVLCLWRKEQINFQGLFPSAEKCQLCITGALFAIISNISFDQCYRQPKPPWLLCIDVSFLWLEKMEMISGFLFEASPWCKEYMMSVLLKTPWPPPAMYNLMHRKEEFGPRFLFSSQCNQFVMLVQRKITWLLPCWVCSSILESFRLLLIPQNELHLSRQSLQLHYSNSWNSLQVEFVGKLLNLQVLAASSYVQMMKIVVPINISRYSVSYGFAALWSLYKETVLSLVLETDSQQRTYMLLVVYTKLVAYFQLMIVGLRTVHDESQLVDNIPELQGSSVIGMSGKEGNVCENSITVFQIALIIDELEALWDPGGSKFSRDIFLYNGLGTSRVSTGGICQDTIGPSKQVIGGLGHGLNLSPWEGP